MSRTNKIQQTKNALIEALEKSLGVVTTACKLVGVNRSTYYDYYNNDPEFRKRADEIENVTIDFVESQLHKQIKEGNSTATIFYLKTKGKKRGYIERQEVDFGQMDGGVNIPIIEWVKTDDGKSKD